MQYFLGGKLKVDGTAAQLLSWGFDPHVAFNPNTFRLSDPVWPQPYTSHARSRPLTVLIKEHVDGNNQPWGAAVSMATVVPSLSVIQ